MRNHQRREVWAEMTIYKPANILLQQSPLMTCALHFYCDVCVTFLLCAVLNLYVMYSLNKTIHTSMINRAIICSDFNPSVCQQKSLSNGCQGQHQHPASFVRFSSNRASTSLRWRLQIHLREKGASLPLPHIHATKRDSCTVHKAQQLLKIISLAQSKRPFWTWRVSHVLWY